MGGRINARRCLRGTRGRGRAPGGGCAPDPRGHPVRRLLPFFLHKKANTRRKIVFKVSIQSELRISGNIRNGERAEECRNRERQRDSSNLGGALAPPTPWRPWTRGETLLPSREKVKEEEKEGGLSPPHFWWRRNTAGAIIITAIYTNTSVIITNISITVPHLSTAVNSPATR